MSHIACYTTSYVRMYVHMIRTYVSLQNILHHPYINAYLGVHLVYMSVSQSNLHYVSTIKAKKMLSMQNYLPR